MTSSSGWSKPPPSPALADGAAAVWLFEAGTPRPIETVLATYLRVEASSVALSRSRAGKPELKDSQLRVSLAHSGTVALVAVAFGGEIGVDVEPVRQGVETWSLVSHALTQDERSRLEAAPLAQRSEIFLSLWTKKEALLKAAGLGLALDPRLVELGEGGQIVSLPRELGEASDWTLAQLPLPGYAAALAVNGPLERLSLYDARAAAP